MRRRLYEGALLRRTTWPNRSAAHAAFAKSPMFAAMHPAQLEGYVNFGLRPTSDDAAGEVTLATPNWCEALTFSDAWTSFETYRDLSKLKAEKGVWLVDAAKSMPK